MAQEIKIPVSADTTKAERGIENMADAFDKAAGGARRMAAGIKTAADQTKQLAAAREYAKRTLGKDIGDQDAGIIADNFGNYRRRSANMRPFSTVTDWDRGQDALYRTRAEAARARRYGNAALLQGTSFAGSGAPPGGGGGGGEHSEAAAGVRRIQQTAMGFGKSMLALAGIGSILAMAAKAKDLATEEAVGTDTLKRRLGDLGVSFDNLRDQARAAGQGLGVTYVESMRLGSAYAREVGNMGAGDLAGDGFSHRMRTQFGFARSYGIDPAESTQFFGQMARYGVGRDEAGQRKLAMLIGDSVARSGYSGQVEQLLHAVADYTSTAARLTLSTPNVGAYVSALTSMIGTRPGLDTANAASILGAADSSVRRGGAMGDASLNFMYAALRNANPNMRPVDALAVMQGGLFGTTEGTFGANGALKGFGGKGLTLDNTTNADKMIPLLLKIYGRNTMGLRAVQNTFGLSSMANARAFIDLKDQGLLGGMGSMLSASHIDPATLNATSLASLGALAAAKNRAGMLGVYSQVRNRGDLTDAQKKLLDDAVKNAGDDERALRRNLATTMASIGQEKTPGEETRDSITRLTDLLTQAGGPLMSMLNPIRNAVVAMAEQFVPGFLNTEGSRPEGAGVGRGAAGVAAHRGSALQGEWEQWGIKFMMSKGWSREQAAAIIGRDITESGIDPHALGDGGKALGIAQWHADRWKHYKKWASENGVTDLFDPASQLSFQDAELRGKGGDSGSAQAGYLLRHATSSRARAAAMLGAERPKGWSYADQDHPENVAGWKDQLANTQRLEGEVKVVLQHPDGRKQTAKVPLIGKPKASGNPFLPAADPLAYSPSTPASLFK